MAQEPSVRLRSKALFVELLANADNGEGFSYRDMADRCSCGKTIIGNLATGEDETCSQSLGERIAEVLGVPTPVLFAPAPSVRRGRPSAKQADAVPA
jgi:hypothetical protein